MEPQRAAAQKQAENVAVRLKPWGDVAVESGRAFESAKPECDAMVDSIAAPLVEGAAREQGVDVKLLCAVIDQESGFHPCAISYQRSVRTDATHAGDSRVVPGCGPVRR
jgi:soluble lytic murein transglycosylase-like protein